MRADEKLLAMTFEPVPEHHEAHTGPYGVEMPPDWEFVVVSVTEVTVEVANSGEVEERGKGEEGREEGVRK